MEMSKTTAAVSLSSIYAVSAPPRNLEGLVENYLSQIKFIASRIAAKLPQSVDPNDLIGAGVIGLLDAAEKYDPSRGVLFKTYAKLRVRGAILDSLRDMDWVPRSVRRRAREVETAYRVIEKKQGRPAEKEDVAEELGISLGEFHQLLSELQWLNVTDLDQENEDGSTTHGSRLADDAEGLPSAIFERTETRTRLAAAIDRLPERERQVVALYYMEELTMKEIGLVLGITESRVSQLHTQAVLHLRNFLSAA